MKSGRGLAALRPFLAGRLPGGAFPASCFLASSFALGLGPRPIAFVAFVALAGLDFGFGTLPPIRGQGPADIVGLNERRAKLVAPDVAFVRACVDELSLTGHTFTFNRCSSLPCSPERVNFLSLTGEPFVALTNDLARLLWSVGARAASFIDMPEHVGQQWTAGRRLIH
jgi:hypothetical protein